MEHKWMLQIILPTFHPNALKFVICPRNDFVSFFCYSVTERSFNLCLICTCASSMYFLFCLFTGHVLLSL